MSYSSGNGVTRVANDGDSKKPTPSARTSPNAAPNVDPRVLQLQQRINDLERDYAVRKHQLQNELVDIRRQTKYNLTRLQGKCEEVKQLKLWIREWTRGTWIGAEALE
jgi:hypothetical protein